MIVKNEAQRLPLCLEAARPAVQEIVVVDTGSIDDTPSVAARFGAHVAMFDFREPDFAGARNASLARATGDWILVLDADEILTHGAHGVLVALVGRAERAGYIVQRRNLRPTQSEPVLIDHALRLFPNDPAYRYRGRVHETIDAAILGHGGRICTSDLVIDHILPPDDSQSLAKSRFYLAILEQELAQRPDDVERLGFRRAELHKLGRIDEAACTAERIAELAPNDPAHHRDVGLYRLVHNKDAKGAESAFRAALALAPDDEQTLNCLRELARSPR
jgi:glycosyltransferase involved in cell wall biosynthesis